MTFIVEFYFSNSLYTQIHHDFLIKTFLGFLQRYVKAKYLSYKETCNSIWLLPQHRI